MQLHQRIRADLRVQNTHPHTSHMKSLFSIKAKKRSTNTIEFKKRSTSTIEFNGVGASFLRLHLTVYRQTWYIQESRISSPKYAIASMTSSPDSYFGRNTHWHVSHWNFLSPSSTSLLGITYFQLFAMSWKDWCQKGWRIRYLMTYVRQVHTFKDAPYIHHTIHHTGVLTSFFMGID